ncbi:MAG: hypothetical protein BWY64_02099 [bacterium ADurb.Bin363]|nr:MAG: hypothetical protein BWY64_02099 [bacterium ADurb.Bin363]
MKIVIDTNIFVSSLDEKEEFKKFQGGHKSGRNYY